MPESFIDKGDCPPAQTSPLLLSVRTLAKRLGLSVRTLWRLRNAGREPKPVRMGGSVRWSADEIDGWVAAGCPDPPPQNNGGHKQAATAGTRRRRPSGCIRAHKQCSGRIPS